MWIVGDVDVSAVKRPQIDHVQVRAVRCLTEHERSLVQEYTFWCRGTTDCYTGWKQREWR